MHPDFHPDLEPSDLFIHRHLGPRPADVAAMLETLGRDSLDDLVDACVPKAIRSGAPLDIGRERSEHALLGELAALAGRNRVMRSYLGMGYHACITPGVILRNILENPGWYTAYTPYQAEISQGRLEMLLNFQTMICDLTGLGIANSSLLDEATAAAEAMAMSARVKRVGPGEGRFFVSEACHPQTIAVVQTRAEALGLEVEVGDHEQLRPDESLFGCLLQYPTTDGVILDYEDLCGEVHAAGGLVTVACDLLSLALLRPPGEFGADIAVGNSQRFGVPLGFGGPHAAFFATHADHARQVPGRIIGVSRDAAGQPALRMALQTREQHIRRQRATSNICTAQVLLAVTAAAYGVYHGAEGIRRIAGRVHRLTAALREGLRQLGHHVERGGFFDTIRVRPEGATAAEVCAAARALGINLRPMGDGSVCVALDETVTGHDVEEIIAAFGRGRLAARVLLDEAAHGIPHKLDRQSDFLTDSVFREHRSETEMLRYLHRLEHKDLSLNQAMIPLGSCTMKLNATTEMRPITWPEFGALHPFAPLDQAEGYLALFSVLEEKLAAITGFDAISLQPNAGSQGEYAGLLAIRAWHRSRGDEHRDVCLIPTSAHGTNPASAVMAGMRVVPVRCDDNGNVEVDDLRARAAQHADRLAALMVTYPSTHGVFEEAITEICSVVHEHGGQVYLDGANLNAMVGLCRPGDFGADVCHLNLHKTFCIPHGGGGPGMGPIGVKAHLQPFLPTHPVHPVGGEASLGTISAAPWGSPSILPISYAYIELMGGEGLTEATRVAILSANYIAHRLEPHYPVLYRGANGLVAHECIIDLRPLTKASGVTVDDVAKRLVDYGFHAPTMSFPVAGTLMIEPTESEPKVELDRFCDAMIAIRAEIAKVEAGAWPKDDNPLCNAPHTAAAVTATAWDHPYSRDEAAFPAPDLRVHKYWSPVARVDNAYGDRNLACTCGAVEDYA